MAVIARDSVASDQLVYAWPFPIGPEPIEVSCGAEEIVVMCPAWAIGDRLGPGRHQWRTPDPAKPTNAYFVLTGPVEVPFDMATSFAMAAPQGHQPVRLRAQGSLLVQCLDPAALVAAFVGLPFDNLNAGLIRSVAASVERLLARVLVRRVLAAGTPIAVTDPSMLPSVIDELTAYNPTAGAVQGVAFVRFNQLVVQADDGGASGGLWNPQTGWGSYVPPHYPSTGSYSMDMSGSSPSIPPPPADAAPVPAPAPAFALGSNPPGTPLPSEPAAGVVSGEIGASRKSSMPPDGTRVTPDGVILPIGARVLVPSPDGTLHASTIRQHQQGYYEVEVGATGQTVWVPIGQVIPEGR